jgi:hypothetical protein
MAIDMDQAVDGTPARPTKPRPRRLSELFVEIAARAEGQISVGAIIDMLGDRSFAAALLLFAALNLLPLPPGATFFTGAPLVLIAMQMVWGSPRVWLPRAVRDRTIPAEKFRSSVDWIAPRLLKIEKLIRPRYWPFWHRQGDIIIGAVTLVLAIIITLPIPLGNWPPALAIAFISLALSERDGIMLAIGAFFAVTAVAIVTLLAASATMFVNYLWHHFFSIVN